MITKRALIRWIVLAIIFLVVAAWASTGDSEQAALARSFLRNLFRSF